MTARRRARGFTLLELLVSMGIFVVLGTSLMVILRGGLATWRRSEARQESYAAAQAVLSQLAEDLRSMVAPHDTPLDGLGDVEARLLCDVDAAGRQRLFLVRTLKAESEHPITGLAGTTIGAHGVVDYRDDLEEARQSVLRATGGAMEVAWVLGPGDVLYRGIKAPPGPPRSLFADEEPYELAPPTVVDPAAAAAVVSPAAASPADPGGADRPALLRPFAMDVLHLDLRFWTQYTDTWDEQHPPRRRLQADERSGPLLYWDSTRAVLAAQDEGDRRRFDTFRARGSLTDPRDDIFPAKVRIELTLREHPAAGSSTFLTRVAGPDDTDLYVQEPGRLPPQGGHVLIDQEWIKYTSVEGDRVVVAPGGRGARNTTPAQHDLSEVVAGRTFVLIVDVPAWREDWSDRERQP